MKELKGIIVPCVTPFDREGGLRLDWLRENYRKWNRTKISGCMALGSNGEFRSLSDEEAVQVIKAASEEMDPQKVFIAGAGRESAFQTIAFIKRLAQERIKIDYISVLTPCYFKKLMTDEAMTAYYTQIADESPYPLLLYCAPGFANDVRVSPEALRALASHANIAGIKDTSADMMSAYMDAVGNRGDFEVLAGSLANLWLCLERGGKGGIVSAANYFPDTCARLFEILETEGKEQAKQYLRQLQDAAAHTGGAGGVAGVKAVMNQMGFKGGYPRLPVLPAGKALEEMAQGYIHDNGAFILER